MSIYEDIEDAESGGGVNLFNPIPTSSGHAQGWYGITTGTWHDFAPKAGISLDQYPMPIVAPRSIQRQVAREIPLKRWAWPTLSRLFTRYGALDTNKKLGDVARDLGSGELAPVPETRDESLRDKYTGPSPAAGPAPVAAREPSIEPEFERGPGREALGPAPEPQMDFEEAVVKVMETFKLDRPGALAFLKQAQENDDPQLSYIKNFSGNMMWETAQSVAARAGGRTGEWAVAPWRGAASVLNWTSNLARGTMGLPSSPQAPAGPSPEEQFGVQYTRPVGVDPDLPILGTTHLGPETLGDIAGQALYFELGGPLLEEIGIPYLSAKNAVAAAGRRALIGGGLDYASTGSFKRAKAAAIGAAIVPPILAGAGRLAGNILSRVLSRSLEPTLPANIDEPLPRADMGQRIPDSLVAPPGENALANEVGAIKGKHSPGPLEVEDANKILAAKQASDLQAKDPTTGATDPALEEKSATLDANHPSFFSTARQGEPFAASRTKLIATSERGDVYAAPEHSEAPYGVDRGISVTNPRIIRVRGSDPYRSAVEVTYPNAPQLLDLYDQLDEPKSWTRELLGREAKIRGYDSVILRGDDPSQDILIDYSGFKTTPHPAITPEVRKTVAAERGRGRVIFARPLEPELQRRGNEALRQSTETPPKEEDLSLRKKPPTELEPGTVEDFVDDLTSRPPRDMIRERPLREMSLDELANHFGFTTPKAFANALVQANKSAWEVFEDSRKAMFEGEFPIKVEQDRATMNDVNAMSEESLRDVQDAVQVVMERHPLMARYLVGGNLALRNIPRSEFGVDVYGMTGYRPIGMNQGHIIMHLNTEMLPGTWWGDHIMRQKGYLPSQAKEFIAETLEHEMTHVGHYILEIYGPRVARLIGVDIDVSPRVEELRAMAHDEAIRNAFLQHRQLRLEMNEVPDFVKLKVLQEQLQSGVNKNLRRVKLRVNQMSFNIGQKFEPEYFTRARPVVRDPGDVTDDYDVDDRMLPIGVAVSPQDVYSPETKRFIADSQRYGLNVAATLRPPQYASDAPAHIEHMTNVFRFADERRAWADKIEKRIGEIFAGVPQEDIDKLWEAGQGLRIKKDGSYVQTAPNIPAHLTAKAMEVRRDVLDPAFEHVYQYKPVATAIIKDNNLTPNERTLWRLKRIQAIGPDVGAIRRAIPDVTGDEIGAAKQTQGMLNFDESNDLRTGYVDGYMTMEPMQNIRAELLNQIDHVNKMKALTGIDNPKMQAIREDAIKRLEEIDKKVAARLLAAPPLRDIVPKRAFFGPVAVANAQEDLGIYFNKDMPSVFSRYVQGIANKRFLDRSLQSFRKYSPGMQGSVKGFNTDFLNNLRGLNGYGSDQALANFVNRFQEFNEKWFGGKLSKRRVEARNVREAFAQIQQYNTFLKLTLTPVRFPIIQMSHVATVFNVAGYGPFRRGMAYVLGNWARAVEEAQEAGVLAKDSDFLKEAKAYAGGSQQNRLLVGGADFFTKYTESFRKAVAYHTFRMQAMEPGFKPNLHIMRTFVENVPGRTPVEMARAYGIAGTDATQFRLSAEGKPMILSGGSMWRLAGQFKTWEFNYTNLFMMIMSSGDKAMMARTLGSLFFMGGIPALSVFGTLYHAVRTELLKHGHILPEETGYQMILNQLGLDNSLGTVDIATLRDPLGLPKSMEETPSWILGPTIGSLFDLGTNLAKADTTGKAINATISAISPQTRAMVDAALEWKRGGIVSPTGEIMAKRNVSEIVIRGLDLSPSIRSQRYGYREDIMTALEAGQLETASRLLKQARAKGIFFGPKSWRAMLREVTRLRKERARPIDQQMQ